MQGVSSSFGLHSSITAPGSIGKSRSVTAKAGAASASISSKVKPTTWFI